MGFMPSMISIWMWMTAVSYTHLLKKRELFLEGNILKGVLTVCVPMAAFQLLNELFRVFDLAITARILSLIHIFSGEEFCSLTDKQFRYYEKLFRDPELFLPTPIGIMPVSYTHLLYIQISNLRFLIILNDKKEQPV